MAAGSAAVIVVRHLFYRVASMQVRICPGPCLFDTRHCGQEVGHTAVVEEVLPLRGLVHAVHLRSGLGLQLMRRKQRGITRGHENRT